MEKNTKDIINKHECDECHKKYRHIEKCKDGKNRCRNCKRHMVTNMFYVPKGDKVSKFNLSMEEKKLLVKNGRSWKEVNGECKYMNKIKRNKYRNYWAKKKQEKLEENKKKDLNKKLIEGLKKYSK